MQQIVDLQNDAEFQSLNIALVNIGIDPLSNLRGAAQQYHVTTPLLSDTDSAVSRAYGVLQWAMGNGEPGHTFVLVGADGRVKWIQDYGAPQNGGLMYVLPADLVDTIKRALAFFGTAWQG